MVAAAAAAMCASMVAVSGTASAATGPPTPERLSGANRYATAVDVAQEQGGCTYVIANGLDFPDGLASSIFYEPILLTTADSLPADTKAELDRLALPTNCGPGGITTYVVGGPSAVSSAQFDLLDTYGDATRFGGANRYETAIAVAAGVDALYGDVDEVIIATGLNFPDALAGGVLAQDQYRPILLNDGPTVRADVGAFLVSEGITSVTILGGTNAVPASVATELQATYGQTVKRVSGSDRFATAVAIADELEGTPLTGPEGDAVVNVNGFGFADALSAAPFAYNEFAGSGAPILLVAEDSIPAPTATYHVTWCDPIDEVWAVGGTAVISDAVVAGAVAAATCVGPTLTKATLTNTDLVARTAVTSVQPVTLTADNAGSAANAYDFVFVDSLTTSDVTVVGTTITTTANFSSILPASVVSLFNNDSDTDNLFTASTSSTTAFNAAPAAIAANAVAGGNLGRQDVTIVATFNVPVQVADAVNAEVYPTLGSAPAGGILDGAGATSITPTPLPAPAPATSAQVITYVWDNNTLPSPALPFSQLRFPANTIAATTGLVDNVVEIKQTLVAP